MEVRNVCKLIVICRILSMYISILIYTGQITTALIGKGMKVRGVNIPVNTHDKSRRER